MNSSQYSTQFTCKPNHPVHKFQGTNKRGLSPVQMGIMMRQLMRRLGIKQFYVQAGDWGSQCATHMATMYPGEVLG